MSPAVRLIKNLLQATFLPGYLALVRLLSGFSPTTPLKISNIPDILMISFAAHYRHAAKGAAPARSMLRAGHGDRRTVIITAFKGSTLGPDSEFSPAGIKMSSMGFHPEEFLADAGAGKTVINLKSEQSVFSQGDPADTVFYVQKGQVRLDVISNDGRKATIAQSGVGDFIGEECIEPDRPARMATATALTDCTVLRIDRKEMLRALHEEPAFSSLFVSYLLARGARFEADLAE